ncbi:hypothetical protein EVG20_g8591 [Dentipellis fragilis]|uniref:F-box domain-containing protein n=1 Tax=Dentipellis fragilis TaxID=205917 RepID=A0A4Y9Y5B6_9AGAM|nr:hypothetical protein EVG20_g8591 [Dentipellis fragilis]
MDELNLRYPYAHPSFMSYPFPPAVAMEDVQMEVPQMAIPTISEVPMIQPHPDPDAMDLTYGQEDRYPTTSPWAPVHEAPYVAISTSLAPSETPAMDWDYGSAPLPLSLRNDSGKVPRVPAERENGAILASSVDITSRGLNLASMSHERTVERVHINPGGLPAELILIILLNLRDLYRKDENSDENSYDACGQEKWHALRLVHSIWNKLFMEYKALWTVIDLSSLHRNPSVGANDQDARLATFTGWKHRVDTHLHLTAGSDNDLPLTFYLVSPSGGFEWYVRHYVGQHSDHMGELQMSTHHGALGFFLRDLVRPAPALQALTLSARSTPDSFQIDYLHKDVQDISIVIDVPSDILGGSAPRLETAIFKGCAVPWDSPILRNGLRFLSVQYPNLYHARRAERAVFGVKPSQYLPTPQQLLDILLSARFSLRYLNLLHALPLCAESPTQAIDLPALQSLQLADLTPDCLALLQLLRLPHPTTVTVYCYEGWKFIAPLAHYLALHSARNDDVSVQVDISGTSEANWLRTSKRGKDCETDFRPHVELQTPYLSHENKRPDILSTFFSTLMSHSNALRVLFLVDTPASTPRLGRGYFKMETLLKDYGHPRMDGITDVIYESGGPQTFLRFLRMERKRPSDWPPSGDAIHTVPLPNMKVLTLKLRASQESLCLLRGEIRATVADRQQREAPLEKIFLKNCEWVERDSGRQWVHILDEYLKQADWHVKWDGEGVPSVLELCPYRKE